MSQFIPDSQSLGLSAPEQVRVNGKEILCVTTCEIYIPLPDVDRMSQGTLERARRVSDCSTPTVGSVTYTYCVHLYLPRGDLWLWIAMTLNTRYNLVLDLVLNVCQMERS